ncbi:type 2 periplasmic-binding domain-containing protein [Photobacterium sanguinicancri]|uniref:Phosphate ABC transporter substrate-binding protein n=1 Tax=Photobacterium sanguinicancri TaxID=875932 RepID=A0AAW7YAJ2_9GAMM|nr:phosphate ABC transporter substrate-binding protein [Photobacterium sanguinicancri]MDO6544529.1 phosphate ABC transporter substrate-binding protein [Photobacterium sanguinicancri]OZS42817.1 phosphate ABC transporter substrate-binding protein [Photobacterium sanguinicancri]
MLKKTVLALCLAASSFAQAAVVVIANPAAADLDASTIKKVYLGKAKSLNIDAIDLDDGQPLKSEFHAKVTGKTEAQLQAYWAKKVFTGKGQPPKAVSSSAIVKNTVANTANAIGYIDESEVDGSVKVILRP